MRLMCQSNLVCVALLQASPVISLILVVRDIKVRSAAGNSRCAGCLPRPVGARLPPARDGHPFATLRAGSTRARWLFATQGRDARATA